MEEKSGLIYYPTDGASLVAMHNAAVARGLPARYKLTHSGSGASTPYIITSNVTFEDYETLEFENGALLASSSSTVTINGPIVAGSYQIFDKDITLEGSPKQVVNARWFGAEGDVTVDTKALQAALGYSNNIYIPDGVYYLDIDTYGEITSYDETVGITVEGGNRTILKCAHTTAGAYVMNIGGSFGSSSPILKNIQFESYTDTNYTTLNYAWNSGTPITTTNYECAVNISSTASAIVAPIVKNCLFRGFSGQALFIGSSTNLTIDDTNYFSDNNISICLGNTASYSVTLLNIVGNFIQKNDRGITNKDYTDTVKGAVEGGVISNNALDNCTYPILLESYSGAENSHITVGANWFEGNTNSGVIVTKGGLDLYNVQVGAGMNYTIQNNTNTSQILANARGLLVRGLESGKIVFACREKGIEQFFISPNATDTAAAPAITWWDDRDLGIFRKATNTLGIAAGGVGIAKFYGSGNDAYIEADDKTQISLLAANFATMSTTASTLRLVLDDAGTQLRFSPDNTISCGGASYRSSVVYSATGTINTSDEREKTFYDTTDTERLAALEIKASIRKYKWNDAIESKGEEAARIHFGVGAQTVKDIMESHGLDAHAYGFFCYDEWDETPEEKNENGEVVQEYIPAGNRYGIRYDELLSFILSVI